jgi:hypothetical protein
MINHISIAVNNPEKVAAVLAEIWNGMALPFPPCPNSYMVLANDGRGTAIEVTPLNTIIVPGEGLPPEENFDQTTPTEEYESKFVESDFSPRYVPTHININTNLSVAEVKAIGAREGWRTLLCNRGEGLFQLIEIWIEDRFMLEVFTPEMTKRYVEITDPQFLAASFQAILDANPVSANNLELVA